MRSQRKIIRAFHIQITPEMERDSAMAPAELVLKIIRSNGWRPVLYTPALHPVEAIPGRPSFYIVHAIYAGTAQAHRAPLELPAGMSDVTLVK